MSIGLKKVIVVQDAEGKFDMWTKETYENYTASCVRIGAAPSFKAITHFNGDEDLFKSSSPSGYSREDIESAYGTGYMRGCEEWDQKYHSRKEPTTPNLTTYLSSLPKVKDAGVLVVALENILREKRREGETNDTYAFNRCWNHADKALTQYNNQ